MNDTLKRRLAGLLVLLALMFMLTWLLPKNWPESGEQSVSSTVVPLVPNGPYGSPPAPAADSTAQASTAATAAPTAAPAPASGLPVPVDAVDASAPPMPAASAPSPASAPAAQLQKPPVLKLTQSLPSAPSPPKTATASHIPVAPPLVPPPPKLSSAIVAPPAPVLSAAPAQARLWYVQIGSFSDRDNAQTTQNLLQNIGYHGESMQATGASGNVFYRVRLGPFPSEAVAQEAFVKVSHQGYPQARVLSEAAPGKH